MRPRTKNSLGQNPNKQYDGDEQLQMTLAACLNRIYKTVSREGLSKETATDIAGDIRMVRERFAISNKSAVLLAAILERNGCCNGIDEEDLAMYIGCTNIEFISFHEGIKELCSINAIAVSNHHGRNRCYCMTREAIMAIESDGEFVPRKITNLNSDELFSQFRFEVAAVRRGDIDNDIFLENIENLINGNPQLEFCRKVKDSGLMESFPATERRFIYYLCHRYVSNSDQSVEIETLMNLTGYMDDDAKLKRFISLEKTAMQAGGMVVFGIENGFVDNGSLSLSDEVKSTFFNEVELAAEPEKKHRDLVCCETIKAKDLFFNRHETEQIGRLDSLLADDNFKGVQARLEEMGMRKGFNAILWGAPGTGKTACVYELARKTGRDIFCIDMSKLKSKWVGDSEKAVKGAFQIYKDMVRTNAKAPIMLFNEADAIFSKRFENISDSVDQMMNAIQNIILQEMENIEGILIATTNLVGNLDPAFERRFIFKIKFEKPEVEVRSRIWKSMVSGLSEEDADRLAGAYDFAGGNIENISRKSTIDYVLTGERPSYESLVKYCQEESLGDKRQMTHIGY